MSSPPRKTLLGNLATFTGATATELQSLFDRTPSRALLREVLAP
jgi:hypothetical protein